MDAQQLTGMAVVSIDEADRLGVVSDVLFQTEPFKVAALSVRGSSGIFQVPFEDVRSLGSDAVTVDSNVVARGGGPGSVRSDLIGLSGLHDLKIVDEDGTFYGAPATIDIEDGGRVTSIDARKGGVLGVGGATHNLSADNIRSVGTEVLTIRSAGARKPADRRSGDEARAEPPRTPPNDTPTTSVPTRGDRS